MIIYICIILYEISIERQNHNFYYSLATTVEFDLLSITDQCKLPIYILLLL